MRKMRIILSFLMSLFVGGQLFAQAPVNDLRANAIAICPNIEYNGTNKFATADTLENKTPQYEIACFDTIQNMVWYKFKTNYKGGHVQFKFTNVACLQGVNIGDSLEAAIVNPNYDPLNPNESFAVGGCGRGTTGLDFVVSSDFDLKPLFEYYLVIDGMDVNNVGASAECDFTIEIFGEGADISIVTDPETASRSLILGERVLVRALGADGNPDNVAWTANGLTDLDVIDNPNGASTFVFPKEETTTYRVVSSNKFSPESDPNSLVCYLKDSIVFYVNEQLNPYNTFTPNGDDVNDLWEIPKIDNVREFQNAEVTVYNRWGQIVYKIIGYRNDKGWDGTFNGQPVPEATYYWTINLNDFFNNNRKYAGSVTIIR
jgi:gliding motility-associated-like protein